MTILIIIGAIAALVGIVWLMRLFHDGRRLRTAREDAEHHRRIEDAEREAFSPAALASRAAEFRKMRQLHTEVVAPVFELPEKPR